LILSKAIGKSVTICSLTTIVAFAALIPASHRGISSLGWVLSVGVTLILLATLIVLPALFELLGSRTARSPERTRPEFAKTASVNDNGALVPEVVDSVPVDPPAAGPPRSTGTHDL
jgi:predicted RND superfamily exporter protein